MPLYGSYMTDSSELQQEAQLHTFAIPHMQFKAADTDHDMPHPSRMGCNCGFEQGNYLILVYRGDLFYQNRTTRVYMCSKKYKANVPANVYAAGVNPPS